jgi:tripartite-type tricarboxylate transporter receptor subunit TctC
MLVRVMSGAGGVVAANYMYELAKPDGLTLWLNEPPLALTQLSGEGGARFDMLGYTYIGAIEKQTQLALLRGDLPFDTIEKLRTAKEPIRAAARRVGSSDYVGAEAIEALGVPIKIVTGYPGSGEQLTALERGEVHLFITSLSSIKSSRPEWLKPRPGVIHHIAALGSHGPDVSHVPNIRDLTPVPGKEAFVRLADFLAGAPRRMLSAPPKTPKEITRTLRDSFLRLVKDSGFLEEANKLRMEISPVPGEELEQILKKFMTDPTVREKAPELVGK